MMNKIFKILLMAGLGFAISSCGGKQTPSDTLDDTDSISIPEAVTELREAVRSGNSKQFASLVSYPLVRPYPLRDILNEDQMTSYYHILVDDSLSRMLTLSPDTAWSSLGWRGWTLDRGQYVWIDEQLYSVPYISKVEHDLRTQLERREMESLPPKYRKGWKPLGCMRSVSSKAVYRIDRNPKAQAGRDYRMMVWADSTRLEDAPTAIFVGRCHTEGTADVRTYFFASKNGAKAVYMGDVNSPDDQPRVLFTDPDGVNHTDTVTSAYWLELLPRVSADSISDNPSKPAGM